MAGNEKRRTKGTDWLGLLSFGFFLILIGTIWMITPNLTKEVRNFFDPENWHIKKVTENISFPEPKRSFSVVYTAAMQFCFIFGVFEIVILALRFVLRESLNKMSGTLAGAVFWFSTGFFLYMLASEAIGWFGFLAGLIISVGLTIIASNVVKLLRYVSLSLQQRTF